MIRCVFFAGVGCGSIVMIGLRERHAEKKAYDRFSKDFQVRLNIVSEIAKQQRKFKEEHPDWPGTLPSITAAQEGLAENTGGRRAVPATGAGGL